MTPHSGFYRSLLMYPFLPLKVSMRYWTHHHFGMVCPKHVAIHCLLYHSQLQLSTQHNKMGYRALGLSTW